MKIKTRKQKHTISMLSLYGIYALFMGFRGRKFLWVKILGARAIFSILKSLISGGTPKLRYRTELTAGQKLEITATKN